VIRSALIAAALCIALTVGVTVALAKGHPLAGSVGPSFTISLKTPAGKRVKTETAGRFTIAVSDKSSSHNFHLIGPGVNKKITKVGFVGKKTVVVTLAPGKYRYQCDPHKDFMHASFTVTK
jgi:hypothetical protein